MRDAREIEAIPEGWWREAPIWVNQTFRWTRWFSPNPDWTHDHCLFCWACICAHRDEIPPPPAEYLAERGCFRHAYYAETPGGTYTWVCRTCFKRVAGEFHWHRARSRPAT